jgi:hypothetical protein
MYSRAFDGAIICTWDDKPYAVTEESNPENWATVQSYLAEHPEALIPEPISPPPSPEELARRERSRIIAALEAIDRKAIRPLRAIAAGSTSEMDQALVEELETEAASLRAELAKI